MGFPQFPSWVSNFVKNLPRSLPADVPPSVANIIAQDMIGTEPAAFVDTYDPCDGLALADLAQMPMHITDPQERKQWCQDCRNRKLQEALPKPNPWALYPQPGNTPGKTNTPAGNVKPPLKLLSASDALGKNTSDNLTNLNLVTGGSGFDERHLVGTSLEDQARHNRETFYQSINRLNSGGDTDTIDTPPGSGFPGFSAQFGIGGGAVVTYDGDEFVVLNAKSHWNRYGDDGDKPVANSGFPTGWNAVLNIYIPGFPSGAPPDPKPKDPKEMTEEEKEQARQLAVLALRIISEPIDIFLSIVEYINKPNTETGINLALALIPGPISSAFGKIIGKLGKAAIDYWDNLYYIKGLSNVVESEVDLTQKINRVQDAIKGLQRREVAYGFSSTGELIYAEMGPLGEAYVDIPLNPRLKNGISIHNHPSGGSFSPADFWATVDNDLKTTIAVGTTTHANGEQWAYKIIRPENGWGGLDIYREGDLIKGKLVEDYDIAYDNAYARFYNERNIGGPNFLEQEADAITDINAYASHHAMQEIAKKWGFQYERVPLNHAARNSKGYDNFFP